MGDGFYGSLPFFIQKPIHSPGSRLCFQMGGGYTTRTNDVRVVAKFLCSHIFTRFETPRALITDGGTHFCNKLVDNVMIKYGVRHRTSLAYHP